MKDDDDDDDNDETEYFWTVEEPILEASDVHIPIRAHAWDPDAPHSKKSNFGQERVTLGKIQRFPWSPLSTLKAKNRKVDRSSV